MRHLLDPSSMQIILPYLRCKNFVILTLFEVLRHESSVPFSKNQS